MFRKNQPGFPAGRYGRRGSKRHEPVRIMDRSYRPYGSAAWNTPRSGIQNGRQLRKLNGGGTGRQLRKLNGGGTSACFPQMNGFLPASFSRNVPYRADNTCSHAVPCRQAPAPLPTPQTLCTSTRGTGSFSGQILL